VGAFISAYGALRSVSKSISLGLTVPDTLLARTDESSNNG